MNTETPKGDRIAKVLARAGVASRREAERMIDNLANLQFDKLGSPQIKTDSIKPVLAPADRPHRLLVIAVEFPEIGYQRFAGDKKQNNNDL